MCQNFERNGVAVINASEETPRGLRFYFSDSVSPHNIQDIVEVVYYWVESSAIHGDSERHVSWDDDFNVLTVECEFKGNFKGNLLHRDAIGLGDSKFSIGLVKLFCEGYIPKTSRGRWVIPPDVTPICIEFLYYEDAQVVDNRYELLFNALMDTVKIDSLKAEIGRLDRENRRLKAILTTATEVLESV